MSVVGYQYAVDNLCPACTIGRLRANGIKVARGRDHEEAVRRAAEQVGIDFSDEHTYDSSSFPKAITRQMARTELIELPNGEPGEIADERCDRCGKWLRLGEKSPTKAGLTRWVRDEHELPQALAREIAETLREWGLSHPAFIDESNVKEAAAQHPHAWLSYRFVDYPSSTETKPIHEPDDTDDECLYCGQAWQAQQHQTA